MTKSAMPVVGLLFAQLVVATARADTVTTDWFTQLGQTPRYVGINNGYYRSNSNDAAWWKRSQANAIRIFWSTKSTEDKESWGDNRAPGRDDMAPWGDGVYNRNTFMNRRMDMRRALRADIEGLAPGSLPPSNASCSAPIALAAADETYANWDYFIENYVSHDMLNALEQSRDLGVKPLIMIHMARSVFPLSTDESAALFWQDRWEFWQHFFVQAYILASEYDITSYQFLNEPDATNVPMDDWVVRARLASDAVQLAIKTVNKRRTVCGQPTLQADVQGPTLASSLGSTGPGTWGYLAMDNRTQSDFFGWGLAAADSFSTVLHSFSFHKYGGNALGKFRTVQSLLDEWNVDMPVYITEFNTSTHGNLSGTVNAMDSAGRAADYGKYFLETLDEDNARAVDGVWAFKFSQTKTKSIVVRNGLHYTQIAATPQPWDPNGPTVLDVGGSTRSAEVVRLFAKGFKDARYWFATDVQGSVLAESAYDPVRSMAYVMLVNTDSSDKSVTYQMLSFLTPANAMVMVEEVSQRRRGEVARLVRPTPVNSWVSQVTFTQPGDSVVLLSYPIASTVTESTIVASDDAMVKTGSNRWTRYGGSANLYASGNVDNPNARNVTFLKFPIGTQGQNAKMATLEVTGRAGTSSSVASGPVVTHVYGISWDNWTDSPSSGIRWADAPNLDRALYDTRTIADNFVKGVGESAEPLGQLTADAGISVLRLDVTDFIREHQDSQVSFMLVREIRFEPNANTCSTWDTSQAEPCVSMDGYDLQPGTERMWMASTENNSYSGPTLRIWR